MRTTEEKVIFLQAFSDMLAEPTFTQDTYARLFEDLREYSLNMLNVFQHELKQEKAKSESKKSTSTKTSSTKTTSTTKTTTSTSQSTTSNKSSAKNLPHIQDNFPNIDEQKVREAILSRHNDERDSL